MPNVFDIHEAIKTNPPKPAARKTPFDKHPRLGEWLDEVADRDLGAPYLTALLNQGAETEGIPVQVSPDQVRRELAKRARRG